MLTNEGLEDLTQLHAVAEQFAAEGRSSGLPRFITFSARLKAHGWSREYGKEHRRRGPKAKLVDLIAAGPKLRASWQLVCHNELGRYLLDPCCFLLRTMFGLGWLRPRLWRC